MVWATWLQKQSPCIGCPELCNGALWLRVKCQPGFACVFLIIPCVSFISLFWSSSRLFWRSLLMACTYLDLIYASSEKMHRWIASHTAQKSSARVWKKSWNCIWVKKSLCKLQSCCSHISLFLSLTFFSHFHSLHPVYWEKLGNYFFKGEWKGRKLGSWINVIAVVFQ